ncbi:hypothetical protein LMG28614_06953 [Paraburkholderia ultramafica]|uniref:Uncharacterized protein n=1 Tax=Paraburkholderia ultramafica TaxID=1544867 RepID=A0A6S7CGG7_9BURK|nr:hypothetical protein [Paraburkholderia ultramafica]CAB3809105.1 hypothetical protein LMG28614_06953 [Paraburkholderia ultramafica]
MAGAKPCDSIGVAQHLISIAHGNRFTITTTGKKRLANHPAHNRQAAVRSPDAVFEIKPEMTGPVLFNFMGPADVIDLLQSVEIHLSPAVPINSVG